MRNMQVGEVYTVYTRKEKERRTKEKGRRGRKVINRKNVIGWRGIE